MSLYLFVGLTGYLLFGTCVCDNISLSFGPNVYVAVGQVAISIIIHSI